MAPPPLERFIKGPERWALFLDFDGTLVELAPSPDAIRVPPRLPVLLSEVSERFDGALALITGRALADLDRHLKGIKFAAAGQHGTEWRVHPERYEPPPETPELAAARAGLGRFLAGHPGVLAEDKGASLALHYRGAPAARADILALAEKMVEASSGALELIEGKAVCELRLSGASKGRVLRVFLAEPPFAGRRPLVLGDDVTDEEAFAAALDATGAAIKVGEGETRAGWRLATPAAARAWLAGMSGPG